MDTDRITNESIGEYLVQYKIANQNLTFLLVALCCQWFVVSDRRGILGDLEVGSGRYE